MRKLLLLVLAFTAGVLTLAWINSRPARRTTPRRTTGPRGGSGDGSPPTRRDGASRAVPTGASSATPKASPSRGSSSPQKAPAADPRRCAGTTASGQRCSREAQEGSRFCWQHG